MPIFEIDIVTRRGETLPDALACELADGLGAALDAAPESVWVRVTAVEAHRYAENGMGAEHPFPVFVKFTASEPPEGARLENRVAQITQVVSRIAGRPAGNVHVLVDAAAKGRIAFGGKLVK
jgi:phenylpyruvate tautomerase PptA (4-oxalocrotonate tautomerase family)